MENFFRFDGDDFTGGEFGGAAGELEFVSVADELIAGDDESLTAFEDDIFGAGGCRIEQSEERNQQESGKNCG
jgi:hypothetical protein